MPKLIPCPTCKREVSEKADSCPACGHHFRGALDVPWKTVGVGPKG